MDIAGCPDPDLLTDTPGDDVIDGGGGDDHIFTRNGHDRVDGGPGEDQLAVNWGAETSPVVAAPALAGYDFRLVGGSGRSVDYRNIESLVISGGSGNDNFTAGGGDDFLYDGDHQSGLPSGSDRIGGGGGADIYAYRSAAESTAAARDRVMFGDGDRIDLGWIDANADPADGNQALTFIGEAGFSHAAGELRAFQSDAGAWAVEGDVDGDGVADLAIGVATALTVTADSFIL
jgi:serralysin